MSKPDRIHLFGCVSIVHDLANLAAAARPHWCPTEGKQQRCSFPFESDVGRFIKKMEPWELYLSQNLRNNEHWNYLEQMVPGMAGTDLAPRPGCLSPLT